jgi:hypothetical protein
LRGKFKEKAMATFNVSASKVVFINVKIEANTPEQAEQIFQQKHMTGQFPKNQWDHHDTGECSEDFKITWVEEGDPAVKRHLGMSEI